MELRSQAVESLLKANEGGEQWREIGANTPVFP